MRAPLQPSPGVFDEGAWRRMDLILNTAAKAGIRLIAPLANFEPEMGGIDWYVREVTGSSDKQQASGKWEAGSAAVVADGAFALGRSGKERRRWRPIGAAAPPFCFLLRPPPLASYTRSYRRTTLPRSF